MYDYKDISALTRTAVIVVSIYLAMSELCWSLWYYADFLAPSQAEPAWDDAADKISDVTVVVFLATIAITGRWIYRASANAHRFAPDLSFTPAWALGWHFVPVANLFMPYRAMRELWLASQYRRDWRSKRAPALLGLWWALWIAFFVLAAVGAGLPDDHWLFDWLDPAKALVNVPLCLTLIAIMRRVRAAQWQSVHHDVFA